MASLNQYVPISQHSGELHEEFLRRFKIVVMTNSSSAERVRVNNFCHRFFSFFFFGCCKPLHSVLSNNIAFIAADVRGVFASIFCDFGPEFTVYDPTGENPKSCMVSSITNENPGIVTVSDESRHGMETGDFVTFSEIKVCFLFVSDFLF